MTLAMHPIEFGVLAFHLAMTAVVSVVGRALLRRTGAGSAPRRTHGRYVFWWCVGGYAAGGLWSPLLAGGYTPVGVWACGGFGLLAGWLVGTVYGGVVFAARWWRGRAAG